MTTLLLAAIFMIAVALLQAAARARGGSQAYPYQLTTYLLTKAERSFYGVLVQAVGSSGLVFSKVRVADVLSPKKGLGRSDWQRAFNAVSSKHFDFLICAPDDCSVRLAVELDDASHGSSKARKRDDLLNGACESAGLPLLRIRAAKSYVLADIRQQVAQTLTPQAAAAEKPAQAVSTLPVPAPAAVAETPALVVTQDATFSADEEPAPATPPAAAQTSPSCPKYGEPMLLRKARSGANAGQEFWGCSAFPRCRAAVKLGA